MSLPSSFNDKAALYQHIKRQLNLYIGMSGLSQSELCRRFAKLLRCGNDEYRRLGVGNPIIKNLKIQNAL